MIFKEIILLTIIIIPMVYSDLKKMKLSTYIKNLETMPQTSTSFIYDLSITCILSNFMDMKNDIADTIDDKATINTTNLSKNGEKHLNTIANLFRFVDENTNFLIGQNMFHLYREIKAFISNDPSKKNQDDEENLKMYLDEIIYCLIKMDLSAQFLKNKNLKSGCDYLNKTFINEKVCIEIKNLLDNDDISSTYDDNYAKKMINYRIFSNIFHYPSYIQMQDLNSMLNNMLFEHIKLELYIYNDFIATIKEIKSTSKTFGFIDEQAFMNHIIQELSEIIVFLEKVGQFMNNETAIIIMDLFKKNHIELREYSKNFFLEYQENNNNIIQNHILSTIMQTTNYTNNNKLKAFKYLFLDSLKNEAFVKQNTNKIFLKHENLIKLKANYETSNSFLSKIIDDHLLQLKSQLRDLPSKISNLPNIDGEMSHFFEAFITDLKNTFNTTLQNLKKEHDLLFNDNDFMNKNMASIDFSTLEVKEVTSEESCTFMDKINRLKYHRLVSEYIVNNIIIMNGKVKK